MSYRPLPQATASLHQSCYLGAYGFFEVTRCCTGKFFTGEFLPQANHESSLRTNVKKISAHSVDLPFDGVARNSTPGPPLGHHGTHPGRLNRKQDRHPGAVNCNFFRSHLGCLGMKPIAVQGKMCSSGNNTASKYGLKLWSGLKPLHTRPYAG